LAVFGQKDYQQSAVIRRLVRDLNLDLRIEIAPTVREADGLAMSSRNVNLTEDERRRVPALYHALEIAKRYIERGEPDTQRIIGEMRRHIEKEVGGDIEYISIVHPDTLEDLSKIAGPVVIALAVRLANVRLIDNISAEPSSK
jgi:pantoate--beta-alanine ligase